MELELYRCQWWHDGQLYLALAAARADCWRVRIGHGCAHIDNAEIWFVRRGYRQCRQRQGAVDMELFGNEWRWRGKLCCAACG